MRQAELAGAIVTDPARDRFWGGYAGHFHDPDGHLWEVAWNPQWPVPGLTRMFDAPWRVAGRRRGAVSEGGSIRGRPPR